FREIDEPHYKSPQLQEQEFRTQLARLRVGERIVRDRHAVRRERVARLRPPNKDFEARTREAIQRVRRRPTYLAARSIQQPADRSEPRGAAAVLRERAAGQSTA